MQVPETEIIVSKDGVELLRKIVQPGDYIIGRELGCDVPIEVELVSRRHAQLTVNYDHALIEDLGSSNGTFVNGQVVKEPTRLWPNQKIQVGAATVELRRVKAASPDTSLAPAQAAVQRLLPEELLREKKYDIGGVVAQGGMGAILDAREAAIKRKVAMKVMLDTHDAGDISRFIAEAQVTGQLEHPNIVPVHELGVDEHGQPYYTMKMVRGTTLKKVLELLAQDIPEIVAKYPLPALLTIFQKVCDAVAFAHSHGVIHRDLKPENIMLGDFGEVLLMDWGLAKILGQKTPPAAVDDTPSVGPTLPLEASGATLAGSIMGTPQYMAPEQARGEVETIDQRSDVYALGAILFHLLFLRAPVSGSDAMQVVEKVARGEWEWPAAKDTRSAPDSLIAVSRKALALDPTARYRSVEDLQADILAFQNGFATSAEQARLGKQILLAMKRHKAASIGVAAVLIVSSVLGTKALIEGRHAAREAARANAALADLKKSAPALLQLAESEAGFQRFDSALEKLNAALALDPGLTTGYWRRAWLLLAQEKFADAAQAVRIAQTRDPVNAARLGAILPLLEELQAAPPAERWNPTRASAVLAHLNAAGAGGEAVAFSAHFQISAADKFKLVKARLVEWLGAHAGEANSGKGFLGIRSDGGLGFTGLPNTIDTVEPLRGLPIANLGLGSTHVKNLEPLRGMPLRSLALDNCPAVGDISPLRGMPLEELNLNGTFVSDLSPLEGMPLRTLSANKTKVADLAPLHGAPLESLELMLTLVRDLSPLKGMPLRILKVEGTKVADLAPLAGMPLEELNVRSGLARDLSPLRGMPLKALNVASTDFSPLVGMKLNSLAIFVARDPHISTLRDLTIQSMDMGHSVVRDLKPLIGLRIKVLNIGAAESLHDLSPLLECTELEELDVTDCPAPIEPLRAHKTLKVISYSAPGNPGFIGKPVEQFWKEYDARKKEAGPK